MASGDHARRHIAVSGTISKRGEFIPTPFLFFERESASRLGDSPAAPRVHGRTSTLDKPPWKEVSPPRGPVESEFLRTVVLGESIAPFRLLASALAVIPIVATSVVDAAGAADAGLRHLAAWLRDAESKWKEHCSKRADGLPRMTLKQQIDHMRKLSLQLGDVGTRVVYAGSGTLLNVAILDDPQIVVEHAAYWCSTRTIEEGRYLCAVLNSSAVLAAVVPMQPRGWRDPRHFDNLVWELPIPEYDRQIQLHRELATAAEQAERVSAAVLLAEGAHFMRQRRAIRDALAADGIADRIDALVARLLNG